MTQRQIDHVVLDVIVPGVIIFALIALAMMVMAGPAEARCPPGTSYGCYPYNGAQVCGCR
jgi:hypothetical protein